MNWLKFKFLAVAMLILFAQSARAADNETAAQRRWAIGTDAVQWAMLGCINGEASYCLGHNWALEAGIRYNPFTFLKGSRRQTHLRQLTPSLGIQYWTDEIRHGWFIETKALAGIYSVANLCRDNYFDGQAVAAGIGGGWCKPFAERWLLSVGAGIMIVLHDTTYYMGPVCGRICGKEKGLAAVPDLSLKIIYLL